MNQPKSHSPKNYISIMIIVIISLLMLAITVQADRDDDDVKQIRKINLQGVDNSGMIYLSSSSSGSVGSVIFDDEDILAYDGAAGGWSLFFDGSDFGLGGSDLLDIDAFHLLEGDDFLFSTRGGATLPGVGPFDDSDILRFRLNPPNGENFDLFLDGSAVGLSSRGEDIDALALLPDGGLIVSTVGSYAAGPISGGDEDLLLIRRIDPTAVSPNNWQVHSVLLDGSKVGLNDSSGEDIWGVAVESANDVLFLSTRGRYAVEDSDGVFNGDSTDIIRCLQIDSAHCDFDLWWQGSATGFSGENIDGLSLRLQPTDLPPTEPSPTAAAPVTATNTAVPTATNTAVPTATNTAVPTATNTAVPTATNTAVPTATNTAVPTATNTAVPTATNTAVPTATNPPPPTATPPTPPPPPPQDALNISQVTDNRGSYPDGRVPTYEKFEITFQVNNTVAGNYQFPYDPDPPFGIDPANYPRHEGISVDAYFLPPGETEWSNAYAQPGFYYRAYEYGVRDNRDWIYPLGDAWKIRFAPGEAGEWQYKLRVRDASGVYETQTAVFQVSSSTNKGFVKVSERDPRYFEHDDGSLFYSMGLNHGAAFDDPIIGNQSRFKAYGDNGSKLVRIWVSNIYGAAWPEFLGDFNAYDGYLPRPNLLPFRNQADGKESLTVRIDYELSGDGGWFPNCVWQFWNDPTPVKPDTDYRIRVKYRAEGISGPRNSAITNYGVVVKTGGSWTGPCNDPGQGFAVTNYGQNNNDWQVLEGTWNSGDRNWLTKLYIVLENVNEGKAYLDSITVQEDLGSGQFGPSLLVDGDFQYDLVYPEAQTWALDQMVRLAEENDVYLQMVIGDKSDKMWWKIDDDGTYVYGPDESDNQTGYYGNWYNISTNGANRTRWLQRAWWRYLQARYGYSPHVFAWEFTNEGDPNSGKHWSATDLLGRYMKCEVFGVSTPDTNGDGLAVQGDRCDYDHPNAHLVTTSFWHSFPAADFWGNSDWPNVDHADLHTYSTDTNFLTDTANYHLFYSADSRSRLDTAAAQNVMPTKPIIRGEVGLSGQSDLLQDTNGVWLHNFTWAALDPGAMIELFWQLQKEIETPVGPDGQPGLYEIYKYFADFVSNIPLNNGYYQDAQAVLTDGNLRVTGQKDLVNNRAHLWIQNRNHTWRRVVDKTAQTGLGGTVTLSGFEANKTLPLEWHQFTTQGTPTIVTGSATTNATGQLTLTLPADPALSDVAVKIGSY